MEYGMVPLTTTVSDFDAFFGYLKTCLDPVGYLENSTR